ncbi:hypothetical protein T459_01225 [Capsicum annuum]|uniref:Uncharacterized protein n=1 Tax=Capsicum annuum TaxID=4072 RepID=A0A2G3AGN9_CAPAN|nr:hypothetical protein T459_01225 [Capsicum annuum]
MSYTIPKDAQILVNVWAITRDPLIWEEPEMFRLHRFLSSDCLISFGVGKYSLYSSVIRIPNCIGCKVSQHAYQCHKSTSQDQNQQPGPKDGPFTGALVEKVEDLVSGLFLPLYFVSSGLKMNVTTIQGAQSWGLLVLVIVTACFGKIVGTIVVSLLCKLPVQEAVTIGFLMNTKGLVELIVPTLAKIEDSRNIPGMLNLTNVSQGIEKREGLRVYVMHLMELSERSLAILMVHKAKKNRLPFWNTEQMQDSNQIIVAFETFSNLSKHAPCSVGILVDRGLGGASQVSSSNVDFSVTALFFGGHDDREALAYGVRIAEHPGISLVVVRFIVDPEVNGTSVKVEMNNSFIPEAQSDDEEFLANGKQKSYIDGSIKYEERIVKNARGTIEAIREYNLCNLFLVGRMPKGQVVVALDKKSDCPELGSLGNLLTLPECSTTTSVLVVQQYRSQLPQKSPSSLKEESSDADCDSE